MKLPAAHAGMQTCGELADASAVAVGKFKVVGFARLLELHTALRRRLRAEDGGATSGGGSGTAGNGVADSGGGTGSRADGGEGRGEAAGGEDDVQPVEEEEPSAREVELSPYDAAAMMEEEELPPTCLMCGVTEAECGWQTSARKSCTGTSSTSRASS